MPWLGSTDTPAGAYPDATGQAAGLVAETDGADGWTFIATPEAGGTGELLMQDGVSSPPVPLETEDGTDWLYEG